MQKTYAELQQEPSAQGMLDVQVPGANARLKSSSTLGLVSSSRSPACSTIQFELCTSDSILEVCDTFIKEVIRRERKNASLRKVLPFEEDIAGEMEKLNKKVAKNFYRDFSRSHLEPPGAQLIWERAMLPLESFSNLESPRGSIATCRFYSWQASCCPLTL